MTHSQLALPIVKKGYYKLLIGICESKQNAEKPLEQQLPNLVQNCGEQIIYLKEDQFLKVFIERIGDQSGE